MGWFYSNDERLRLRADINRRYSQNAVPWTTWLLDHIPITGSEAVLEVGCGYGALAMQLADKIQTGRILATDLSQGMIDACWAQAAGKTLPVAFQVADAELLPFQDQDWDMIIAAHMLYHLNDVPVFLKRVKRLLRPGGKFVATTNNVPNDALLQLHYQAVRDLGLPGVMLGQAVATPFYFENAFTYLAPEFPLVEEHLYENSLVIDAIKPVLDYYASGIMYAGTDGPADPRVHPELWEELYRRVEAGVTEAVAGAGSFTIKRRSAIYICSGGTAA